MRRFIFLSLLIPASSLLTGWLFLKFYEPVQGRGKHAFLGSGVGIFVAILNILTINIAPEKSNSFLTGLHAFLGIGSAIAPQLVTLANQYGLWQASAFITAGLFTMILIASFGIFPLESSQGISRVKDSSSETSSQRQPFPIGAWVFLVMVFFYALIETTLNYWSSDYIQQEKGLGLKEGLLALSIFWAMVTVGRLGAALLSLKINSWYLYLFSPIIICIGIVLLVPAEGSFALYTYFLLGLGCSYFFPLSISLSASCFPEHKEKISSLSIASLFLSIGSCNYILGYLKNNSGIGFKRGLHNTWRSCPIIVHCSDPFVLSSSQGWLYKFKKMNFELLR